MLFVVEKKCRIRSRTSSQGLMNVKAQQRMHVAMHTNGCWLLPLWFLFIRRTFHRCAEQFQRATKGDEWNQGKRSSPFSTTAKEKEKDIGEKRRWRVGKGEREGERCWLGILLNWGRRSYKAPRKSAPGSTPDIPSRFISLSSLSFSLSPPILFSLRALSSTDTIFQSFFSHSPTSDIRTFTPSPYLFSVILNLFLSSTLYTNAWNTFKALKIIGI